MHFACIVNAVAILECCLKLRPCLMSNQYILESDWKAFGVSEQNRLRLTLELTINHLAINA